MGKIGAVTVGTRAPSGWRTGRSRLRFAGAVFASAFAMLLVASTSVFAGEGNPNYLGILSSTPPTGYKPSPSAYDLSQGQSMLSFSFTVTNKTAEQQSMNLQLNLDHILTYRGQNVSDGQPGVTNGAVVDGQFDETQSTQAADSSPTIVPFTIGPNATKTVTMSRALVACGYYQVDVTKAGLASQMGLVGLEIRVLGCTTPVASPSPSESPSASPSATPSGAAPSPAASPSAAVGGATGGVSATTAGVPLANTGLPILGGLAGLLVLGLGAAGIRRRRK